MTTLLAASLGLLATTTGVSGGPPETTISNGRVKARLFLPDRDTGFYRGTRFDWSGVICGLEFAGHDFFPVWFQRTDPKVPDFIYDGPDIVAGPCTAITGPSEEFSTDGQALGFAQAKAGGTFIKIGVGVLRRPDESKYDMFRLYEIVDGGAWTIRKEQAAVSFVQEVADASSGYGYRYGKTVSLPQGKPQLVLEHALRNTGKRAIRTSCYNHNFLYLDKQPPGLGTSITVPFAIRPSELPPGHLAEVRNNQIRYLRALSGKDRVYFELAGFGKNASEYDIRIENRQAGAGVRITCDQPLSRAALWSIRAPLSFEPFIDIHVASGEEFRWTITYDLYTTPLEPKSSP